MPATNLNIRAVIADDSAFLRMVLRDVLEDGGVKVVGEAKNGKEAVAMVREMEPDILILDCEMPVMNGLAALRIIMESTPLPVLMFSSLTTEGASVTIKALEYGAVDFLLKPTGTANKLDTVADDLVRKIRFITLKNKFRKMKPLSPAEQKEEQKKTDAAEAAAAAAPKKEQAPLKQRKIDIIAIGSSTGGVQAIKEVIPLLPAKIKPIVWVQHMPPNFTKSLAERLDQISQVHVTEVKDGDELKENTCYLAQGGYQMALYNSGSTYKLRATETQPVSHHCPSCNVLFSSVAEYFSDNALGVILTGMGDDGADGLVKMHKKGAFVIGQNEESCVVYGMPKSAYKLGAVDVEMNIKQIAGGIKKVGGF